MGHKDQTGEGTGTRRAAVSTGGFPLFLKLHPNLKLNASKSLQRALSPNYIWPRSSLWVLIL